MKSFNKKEYFLELNKIDRYDDDVIIMRQSIEKKHEDPYWFYYNDFYGLDIYVMWQIC